jgi:hypothetical protein
MMNLRHYVYQVPDDVIDYCASHDGDLVQRLFSCILYKRPIPDKLRREFVLAVISVMNEDKTWDDVFGAARKKGRHREKDRWKRGIAPSLVAWKGVARRERG